MSKIIQKKRVVITGLGLCSPIGNSLDEVATALAEERHGIARMADWDRVGQLATRLAAPVHGVERSDFPRKKIRTMGRVALLAAYASDRALHDAGLADIDLSSGRVGLAYGSTHGSTSELETYARTVFTNNSLAGLESTGYLTFMSHTCAANLAMYYGIQGRIITTCSACVSASQAIGYGYEAVAEGKQDVMVCGGAEELHFTHAGIFDIMYATSTKYNDNPELSPRPFDAGRDGLVVGEGAATVILESYDRAVARGAKIYAEILGYGTNCDGQHITRPSWEGMAGAMKLALQDAEIPADQVDYVNAHGTATSEGDPVEIAALKAVFGHHAERLAVSATKSMHGHLLGAVGAMEALITVLALARQEIPPTAHLEEVAEECQGVRHVMGVGLTGMSFKSAVSNSFAFGGSNAVLAFRAVS